MWKKGEVLKDEGAVVTWSRDWLPIDKDLAITRVQKTRYDL